MVAVAMIVSIRVFTFMMITRVTLKGGSHTIRPFAFEEYAKDLMPHAAKLTKRED
jgi:hypothetical protein